MASDPFSSLPLESHLALSIEHATMPGAPEDVDRDLGAHPLGLGLPPAVAKLRERTDQIADTLADLDALLSRELPGILGEGHFEVDVGHVDVPYAEAFVLHLDCLGSGIGIETHLALMRGEEFGESPPDPIGERIIEEGIPVLRAFQGDQGHLPS